MRIGKSRRAAAAHFAFTVSLLLLLPLFATAQNTWSLEKCIDYAQENALSLKQAEYNIDLVELTQQLNQQARYPSLSGQASGGFQFGRTIDPTTNSFNNERISFNSYALNLSMPLYSGGAISNAIQQSEYDLEAAKADAQFTANNLALNIANAYLTILIAEEQLENARKRQQLTQSQLEQTDKLIRVGSLPENNRLEILAQIARDEQVIIQAQNTIDLNYLNLKELMQLDPNTEMTLERPEIVIPAGADPDAVTFREVYNRALGTQPQVTRDEYNLRSAETGVDIARGALMPSLFLFGGIDTRWSSASKVVTGTQDGGVSEQEIIIDGTSVVVGFPVEEPVFADNPYFEQLDQNFGQNIGLSLQVPIYQNGRNSVGVERAQVGVLSAKLQSDLTKQQLKADVQNAIATARAAERSLIAAQTTLESARAAFQNAEKLYELGAINTFQYVSARNNVDLAEIDLTSAKYDYLFRLKIIDFYLGKELELE